MQRLQVSCAVRPIYGSLGAKGLTFLKNYRSTFLIENKRIYSTENQCRSKWKTAKGPNSLASHVQTTHSPRTFWMVLPWCTWTLTVELTQVTNVGNLTKFIQLWNQIIFVTFNEPATVYRDNTLCAAHSLIPECQILSSLRHSFTCKLSLLYITFSHIF
jgi:hypothetical protein